MEVICNAVRKPSRFRTATRTPAVHPATSRATRTICTNYWTEYLMTASWTEKLFNLAYVNAEGLRHSRQSTSRECDLVLRLLDLKTSDSILDLACGHGRHALELAKRGFRGIVGLDYSEAALDHARAEAKSNLLALEFVQGDMRTLEFEQQFKAIYNVYNSMFYWDDSTHHQILQGIYRALQPNGKFLLEVYNRDAKVLEKNLEQHWFFGRWRILKRHLSLVKGYYRFNNLYTITTSKFDIDQGVMYGTKTIRTLGKTLQTDAFMVRLYTLSELKTMLLANGFVVEQIVSSPDGETSLRLGSPRLMIIARKGHHEKNHNQ